MAPLILTFTPNPDRAERGFTTIELMVVVVILMILAGIGAFSVHSARSTGQSLGATAAANAYGSAIDRFARDHHGRYPAGPGSADWPTANGGVRGPAADILGVRRFYLRAVPESVQNGSITFGTTGEARLAYRQLDSGAGYEIIVSAKGRTDCAIRGGSTTGASAVRVCGNR